MLKVFLKTSFYACVLIMAACSQYKPVSINQEDILSLKKTFDESLRQKIQKKGGDVKKLDIVNLNKVSRSKANLSYSIEYSIPSEIELSKTDQVKFSAEALFQAVKRHQSNDEHNLEWKMLSLKEKQYNIEFDEILVTGAAD